MYRVPSKGAAGVFTLYAAFCCYISCGMGFMPESRLQSGVSAVLRKIRKPRCETILRRGLCILRIEDFCAVVIGNRCSCGFGDCVSNRMLSMLHATHQAETQGGVCKGLFRGKGFWQNRKITHGFQCNDGRLLCKKYGRQISCRPQGKRRKPL